ncbi:SCP2 sterol-binding domain-containing protein [Bacillus circulans]|nr:SCP2 sterol-binding domain-containing protein [Niallia circulans]NRG28019.1 SCP2 sterol-binding domain-containing protein [Niallia circulans]
MKCFVEKLNRKESLKPLLRNASLSLVLTCQNESYYMELKNNRFSWRRMKGEDNPDIWLTGDMTSISLVMEGEILLREAKKNGSIQLEGSLRKILLLESVFFLSHSRSVPHTG